jgi:hypothetical protein
MPNHFNVNRRDFGRNGPAQARTLTTVIDTAHQDLRGLTAGASSLAQAASGVLTDVVLPDMLERLGWDPLEDDLTNAETVLDRLAEVPEDGGVPNAYVLFDGTTPENETRDFVVGNAKTGNVVAVLLVLFDSGRGDRFFLFRPAESARSAYTVDELPRNIAEVLGGFDATGGLPANVYPRVDDEPIVLDTPDTEDAESGDEVAGDEESA